jgi:hypothetical protein
VILPDLSVGLSSPQFGGTPDAAVVAQLALNLHASAFWQLYPLAEDLNVYCEREQLPHEEGTFMTAEKYMALHQVAGMVLLCEECAPVGSLRLGE